MNAAEKLPEFNLIQLAVVATKPILEDFTTANQLTFKHHFREEKLTFCICMYLVKIYSDFWSYEEVKLCKSLVLNHFILHIFKVDCL